MQFQEGKDLTHQGKTDQEATRESRCGFDSYTCVCVLFFSLLHFSLFLHTHTHWLSCSESDGVHPKVKNILNDRKNFGDFHSNYVTAAGISAHSPPKNNPMPNFFFRDVKGHIGFSKTFSLVQFSFTRSMFSKQIGIFLATNHSMGHPPNVELDQKSIQQPRCYHHGKRIEWPQWISRRLHEDLLLVSIIALGHRPIWFSFSAW